MAKAMEIRTVQSFTEVEQLINVGWKIVSKNTSPYGTVYLMKRVIQDYDDKFPVVMSLSS